MDIEYLFWCYSYVALWHVEISYLYQKAELGDRAERADDNNSLKPDDVFMRQLTGSSLYRM